MRDYFLVGFQWYVNVYISYHDQYVSLFALKFVDYYFGVSRNFHTE